MKKDTNKVIWDHFQSDATHVFDQSRARYQYIAHRVNSNSVTLNIGVGAGGLESILIKKGIKIYCLDPSEKAIQNIKINLNLGNQAQVGFSQNIPFSNEMFDTVIMTEVLEHLEDEVISSTLEEVFRVLKPNGSFIGTVPANEILSANETICPNCSKQFHRWGHMQSFSIKTLKTTLNKHSFINIQAQHEAFPDWERPGLRNKLRNYIRFILGKLGSPISSPNIYFEARKV